MRAVVCQRGALDVVDLPDPRPGRGQLVLEVLACGICGSDLHTRHHADEMADSVAACGYDRYLRSDQQGVFGHEILGRVVEHGPGTRRTHRVGADVVALPLVRRGGSIDAVGLSASAPGAYAERVVVQEALALEVPEGLDRDRAAVTEPMAVAWHAVNRADIKRRDTAVVVGCGPVGLAVVLVLKARGVRRVIASDPSAARRALAEACGADVVVDPTEDSPFDPDLRLGYHSMERAYVAAVDAIEKLDRIPGVGWAPAWRLLEGVGLTTPHAPVVFECVGVPGIIDTIAAQAPLFSRVVVVGVCMGLDAVRPSLAINKELELRFVVGYTPLEFRDTLRAIGSGRLDPAPLVTGRVGLGGVAEAFDVLGRGEHCKILIDPALGPEVVPV